MGFQFSLLPCLVVEKESRKPIVTTVSLKFNLIASRVELMNYLIYFRIDIILYYDILNTHTHTHTKKKKKKKKGVT